MSREERRAYERMMRNMERGPALPPAARARAERNAARRAARRRRASTPGSFTTRFWVVSILVALARRLPGLQPPVPNMPFALYLGGIVAVVILALQIGIRILRAAGRAPLIPWQRDRLTTGPQ